MTDPAPVLHLLCGKIAAGKSTLAADLSNGPGTVLISEDAWLKPLYGDQMQTGAEFLRCSDLLRQAMAPHVVALLGAGNSVVLDFAANTVQQRRWMKGIVTQRGRCPRPCRDRGAVLAVHKAFRGRRFHHRPASGGLAHHRAVAADTGQHQQPKAERRFRQQRQRICG